MTQNQETPPFNVECYVYGTDCWGDWRMKAKAVPYKPGSTKAQLRRVYRWLDSDNNPVNYVERWEAVE